LHSAPYIFGIDHRSWLAAELAGQGRIGELRQAAAAGQRSQQAAAGCPSGLPVVLRLRL